MLKKGIVIKLKRNYAIILSEDNEYQRIKLKNNISVGQKIMYTNIDIVDYQDYRGTRRMNNKTLITVAAVLFLVICTSLFSINHMMRTNVNEVVAVVTVDINPSVKISIDENDKVVDVEGLNPDGESLDLSLLIGTEIDEAIETVVNEAKESGFINSDDLEDDYVLITTIPTEENNDQIIEKIETLIEDKVQASEDLQNVNIAMIYATLDQLSEAEDKNISVGLIAAEGTENDDETVSIKDFFASEESREKFINTGIIIEQDMESKIELMEKYMDKLELEGVNIENLQSAFRLSKEDFFKAKELYTVAKEEYKKAKRSGDAEKIESAKQLMEEAAQYKDLMEQNKDDVELIKEKLKEQIEALEENINYEDETENSDENDVNEEDDDDEKEEEKEIREQEKKEAEERREEEKEIREQEKERAEEHREEEKEIREQEKEEAEEHREEEKEIREREKEEAEERREEEKEVREREKEEAEEHREEEKEIREQEKEEAEERREEEKEIREQEKEKTEEQREEQEIRKQNKQGDSNGAMQNNSKKKKR